MTCNIKDRFFRIAAGTALFVFLTAANSAWAVEQEERMKSRNDQRSDQQVDESGSNPASASDDNADLETVATETETGGNASAGSRGEYDVEAGIDVPSADPLVDGGKEIAEATYHFVEDINATAQGAVAETVAQDVGATVDASIREDVRTSIAQDLLVELTSSLPIVGQD